MLWRRRVQFHGTRTVATCLAVLFLFCFVFFALNSARAGGRQGLNPGTRTRGLAIGSVVWRAWELTAQQRWGCVSAPRALELASFEQPPQAEVLWQGATLPTPRKIVYPCSCHRPGLIIMPYRVLGCKACNHPVRQAWRPGGPPVIYLLNVVRLKPLPTDDPCAIGLFNWLMRLRSASDWAACISRAARNRHTITPILCRHRSSDESCWTGERQCTR